MVCTILTSVKVVTNKKECNTTVDDWHHVFWYKMAHKKTSKIQKNNKYISRETF